MNFVVCCITNFLIYEQCLHNNAKLADSNIKLLPLNNKKGDNNPSALYNKFLDDLPEDAEWLIFCRESLEFLESPFFRLSKLSPDALYGIWGARLTCNANGDLFQECLGEICVEDGVNPKYILTDYARNEQARSVDTLDSLCLIVHASLIKKHALRFDSQLTHLHVEDFCLAAQTLHQVPSMVLGLQAFVRSNPYEAAELLAADIAHCALKYSASQPRAGVCNVFGNTAGKKVGGRILYEKQCSKDGSEIYHREVDAKDSNLPVVLAAKMIRKESCVLDVGCACGDNGIFLKKAVNAKLWGMEYNAASLAMAQKTGVYEEVYSTDLNVFEPAAYSQFYGFFDHILLADVLEHVLEPDLVLKKLSSLLKENGSFVISLPNIAHAYPILNLLDHNFTYEDCGILDATHLRFFTWKSLASSLAMWGFKVEDCRATFVMPDEIREMQAPKHLPAAFYDYLLGSKHFLTCQYLIKATPSAENCNILHAANLEKMDLATSKNPLGFKAKQLPMQNFNDKLNLSQGHGISDVMRKHVKSLVKSGYPVEAIFATKLFDDQWYRQINSDVDFSEQNPLGHYLAVGWLEGRNPSEAFNTNWYLQQYPWVVQTGICPLLHYTMVGIADGLSYNEGGTRVPEQEYAKYAKHVISQESSYKESFVSISAEHYEARKDDTRLIAFYLPQYSPFPENDEWWGKGFTEWTNSTRAVPQFAGHYQPRLPYDVGFYDLRLKESVMRQVELAKQYGIHGFCYHYYWFDGKKLMHDPIEGLLGDRSIDVPFCISWANEPWSARWDGSNNELLMGQPAVIDTERFFADILPYFQDPRYICVEGKPFFMLYNPLYFSLEVLKRFVNRMRELAHKSGLPGLHIVFGPSSAQKGDYSAEEFGIDAFIEFPPRSLPHIETHDSIICNPKFKGRIFDLPSIVEAYKASPLPKDLTYRTVFPMWDNTARRAEMHAWVYKNSTPELYAEWLGYAIKMTKANHKPENNLVFINAWNEWAEGAYLEPDRKYGYAFLEATHKVLLNSRFG